ncbi:MAG: aspartate carbamoyltransferase regulatory subunit [Clostridiales Family XIII bacterium]|jgi:aspartate carbamoyltransferase regulatory subunit|nr:aspartate carbamoyltransferase regulatory subunit [Clostridiales Family XIII bacterium]
MGVQKDLVVDSISRGIVIDHLKAGTGLRVLHHLGVDTQNDTVALILNASSSKMGKKDLIKIENLIDVDFTALGLIDHTATVNIIEADNVVRKIPLSLPDTVRDVIKCKNPRCVTSTEGNIPHIFHLVSADDEKYRCEYCDEIVRFEE